jgi:predicted DNA-binding antitoxin AbrB/MazE fold protein
MGVQQSIPAVYEDGVFKPLEPVYGVTEHAQVHLIIQTEEAMAQQLAAFELFSRLHRACKATASPACCMLISA